MSNDRQWTTIGLAGVRSDGLAHVEVVDSIKGTGDVAARMAELVKKWRPIATVLHPGGPAGSLLPALEQAKIDVTSVWTREVRAADAGFLDAVTEGLLRHVSQPVLNISVRAARKQPHGDAWAFRSNEPSIDIAPLKAVSLALFALSKGKKRAGTFRALRR